MWLLWFVCSLFTVAGLFLQFALVGYSFLALICYGMTALLVCYWLLHRLSVSHKSLAKALRLTLTIFLCLGLLFVTITGVQVAKASMGNPETTCEYLIVLGAGVNGTVPSLSLKNRLDSAAEYLQAHPGTTCIVSGGQGPGEAITEAECMYTFLIEQGIDPERIWQEDKATSTRENIQFSLDLIEDRTGVRPEKAGILSSEYHLFRAGLVAKEQGLHPIGVPGKTTLPILFLNYFLREIPAVWYYTMIGA